MGKFNLLAGRPGVGKSLISLWLAAQLSRGGLGQQPSDTLLLMYEDDAGATIKPRAEAMGADLARIHFIHGISAGESESLEAVSAENCSAIAAELDQRPEIKLLIIDPVMAFMGGKIDTHRDASVRAALNGLVRTAQSYGVAVLGICHLNKGLTTDPLEKIGGSIAFAALARSVLLAGEEAGSGRKALLQIKNNLGRKFEPLEFEIQNNSVNWIGEAHDFTPDQVLGQQQQFARATKPDEASEMIQQILSQGPVIGTQVKSELKRQGFSEATIWRAVRQIGVKCGRGKNAEWSLQNRSDHLHQDEYNEHYSESQIQNGTKFQTSNAESDHYSDHYSDRPKEPMGGNPLEEAF